jgi:hypothetical protein
VQFAHIILFSTNFALTLNRQAKVGFTLRFAIIYTFFSTKHRAKKAIFFYKKRTFVNYNIHILEFLTKKESGRHKNVCHFFEKFCLFFYFGIKP